MVNRKNIDKKYALISVFDKSKLKYLCANLKKFNYEESSINKYFNEED